MTQAWRRLIFTPVEPATSPGEHSLRIIFGPDGEIEFQANTDDPERLAALALPLFEAVSVRPELLLEAAGAHGGGVDWHEDDDQGDFRG